MLLRLLIGLATAGSVGGTVAAFALTSGSSHSGDSAKVIDSRTESQENTDLGQEVRGEETETRDDGELEREPEAEAKITQPIVLQIKDEEKTQFEGKLVFNRENKGGKPPSKLPNITYEGQIFTNDKYLEKEKKWKEDQENDDDFKEAHITIDLLSGKAIKNKQELQEYLGELNDKLEKAKGNHLEKLKTTIETDKKDFQENFGEEAFKELLKRIEELKNPSRS